MKAKAILLGGALLCSTVAALGQVRVDSDGILRVNKSLVVNEIFSVKGTSNLKGVSVDGQLSATNLSTTNLTVNQNINLSQNLTVGSSSVQLRPAGLFIDRQSAVYDSGITPYKCTGVYSRISTNTSSRQFFHPYERMGVYGEAIGSSPFRTMGVFGYASGGTRSYGVLGIVEPIQTDNRAVIAVAGYVKGRQGYDCSMANGAYAGYFDGKVHVLGTLTASAVTTSSDECLKKDMLSLGSEKVMDKLMLLKPIEYRFKQEEVEADSLNAKGEKVKFTVKRYDEKSQEFQKKHYGLVAQELQKVYPDLVYDDGKYLSVNYTELVPLLLQAIQEQQKAIEELQKRLPAYDVATPVADGKEVNTKTK